MLKKMLVFSIISMFFLISISSTIFGVDTKIVKRDEILDNITFFYHEYFNYSKFNHYNEYFQINNPDNVDMEDKKISIKSSGPMDSPWSMKCHDTHHTSRSPYSTAHIDGLEKWRFSCEGVDGSPIIGYNGTIYFGDKYWDLYAISPDGTLKWKYQTDGRITSSPALAEDGTLYVGSWDDKIYAFNSSTGVKKWTFNSGDSISSSPAIAVDGTIYFGTMWGLGDGGKIYAVYPDGTEKWCYQTDYHITSDPAIGDEGIIYIGSGDTYLYAMNPDGTLKWRFKTDDYIKGPPSISEDGIVYIGSFDGYLYALYPNNGSLKWKYEAGTETNPSIASDGTIYIGSLNELHAIYPNGTGKWTFDVGSSEERITQSSPAISADGTIYVGTKIDDGYGGSLIAINNDGTENWRKQICHEWIRSSPCISIDGTVYIGSQDEGRGYIHAFGPVESNSPPESPSVDGPTNGEIGEEYWYNFKATDLDNNPISWYIQWGDGRTDKWTTEWASDDNCWYTKTWNRPGSFTIRAKARDTLGEETDWAYLDVTMSRTRTSTSLFHWYELLMDRFPILERLLFFL